MRTREEIEEMFQKANTWTSNNKTAVWGMTYEQGVEEALGWVLEEHSDFPIEEEYEEESGIQF